MRVPSVAMRRAVATTPAPAERLAFLEGMRGLCALYVVLSHVFSMVDPTSLVGGRSLAPVWIQSLEKPFSYGHVAVAMFIVISGFCLELGLLQSGGSGEVPSLRGFFRRRAQRIMPAYYACLVVSALVAFEVTTRFPYPPFNIYLPVDVGTLLSHIFLVQNLSPDWMYKLNGVLWSISIEVQLYLFFPFLVHLQARRGRGVLLLFAALVGLGIGVFVPAAYRIWFFTLFAVGIAASHLVYRPPLRGRNTWRWVALFGWIALFGGIATLVYVDDHSASDVPLGIALACLCALGTNGGGGWLIRLLGSKPLAALGGFSYSLYLMHHPIEQIVYWLRPSAIQGPEAMLGWLFGVGVPTMLLGSWLFSMVFERPFLRRKTPRRAAAKRVVPAQLPLPGLKPF